MVVSQALAQSGEIEQSGEAEPILGESCSGAQVSIGKVGLNPGACCAFVTEEVSEVAEGRSGDGELPVENGGYRPAPVFLPNQQIPFAEVSMDEAGLRIEGGELGSPLPDQVVNAIAQVRRHAVLQIFRSET
jgi:hypothetical protein